MKSGDLRSCTRVKLQAVGLGTKLSVDCTVPAAWLQNVVPSV